MPTLRVKKLAAVYRTDNVCTMDSPCASPPPQLTSSHRDADSINARARGLWQRAEQDNCLDGTGGYATADHCSQGQGRERRWEPVGVFPRPQDNSGSPADVFCWGPATLRAPASFCQMQVYYELALCRIVQARGLAQALRARALGGAAGPLGVAQDLCGRMGKSSRKQESGQALLAKEPCFSLVYGGCRSIGNRTNSGFSS